MFLPGANACRILPSRPPPGFLHSGNNLDANNFMKNCSTLRRLVADHGSLHAEGLPPNYLFPPPDASINPDDLTQLTVLLTGSYGTPYSQGLWRLHLKIPDDYPKRPPKVAFKTRIWHPNVEESTGGICVDTLKKDWESKLTLRDILIVSVNMD